MAETRVYIPDRYVFKVWRDTLAYIGKRGLNPRHVYKLVPRDIMHFWLIIYYMGYCKLPSKRDYWSEGDDICGDHPVCRAFGMTYKKFGFIWRNIYLMTPRDDVQDGESDDEGDLRYSAENSSVRAPHYDVVRRDDEEDDFHFDEKARSMVDLTNAGNKIICHYPSHIGTIDEQMNRFKGRSPEIYKMHNKPITCGFKWFSLVDAVTKFLWHMLPYGRTHKRGYNNNRQVSRGDVTETWRIVLLRGNG